MNIAKKDITYNSGLLCAGVGGGKGSWEGSRRRREKGKKGNTGIGYRKGKRTELTKGDSPTEDTP
jgi:hypothetical protein